MLSKMEHPLAAALECSLSATMLQLQCQVADVTVEQWVRVNTVPSHPIPE
jgi:hypothetical protein